MQNMDGFKDFEYGGINLYPDVSDREDMNVEIFCDVALHHYPLRDYKAMWNDMHNVVKDYDKAFRCFKQGAEAGDVPAMYYLAYCYLNGLPSTQRSAEKAAEWYKRGADYGDADCQVQLAILYHRGQGVKKDNNKAAELLLKANDYFLSANGKENATACYYLYEVYTELGNLPDAGRYLHRAAELGNKQAAALVDGLNSPAEKSPEIEIETENKSLPETIDLPEQPAKTEE